MIRHIVAIDQERGIARNGVQPWDLPSDAQYFREQTKKYGGVVVMGRKTYEVIGRPLPDRLNYVLTHDVTFAAEGVTVIHDLQDALNQHTDIWIIGGQEIYEQTLDIADELYATEINATYGCDRFYPEYSERFRAAAAPIKMSEHGVTFRYCLYVRN